MSQRTGITTMAVDLLRDAREEQTAILDAIHADIALIDHTGVILAVNEAWRSFAVANSLRAEAFGVGTNYLGVCDRAIGEEAEEAAAAAAGIRGVLDGSAATYTLDYPCHSAQARRWFRLTATPMAESGHGGAVLMHQEVTEAKFAAFAAEEAADSQANLMAALSIERARLVTAQAVAKVGSWETDLRTLEVLWSDETYRIFGLDQATFYPNHQTFLTHCHPDDRAKVDAAFQASVNTRALCMVTHRIVLTDGSVKHVEERWHTIVDRLGTPARAVGTCQDITESTSAASALRESQSLLRVAAILSKVGAFRVTLPDGTRAWSDEACAIYDVPPGYTPTLEEALAFYVPADRARMFGLYQSCLRDGNSYDAELEIVTRRGRPVWIRTIGEAVRDASGAIVAIQGAVQDITERRAAVEALLRSEERFRQSFDSAPVGILIISIDGHIGSANAAFCKLLGYTPDQLRGRPFVEMTHPDERVDNLAQMQELVDGDRQEGTFEKRYITADGRIGWARISVAAPRDKAGRALYLITTVADITGERDAQEAVRLSEERFRQTFDLAPMGIIISSPEGRFTEANIAFRRMVGYTSDELRGLTFSDLTHPDDRAASVAAMALLLQGSRESVVLEKRYLRTDGRTIWARVSIAAPRDPNGRTTHFITVVDDITASRVAAEALRVSEERFRVVFEQAGIAIALVDASDGRIIRGNGALAAMLGYDLEELTRLSVETISETTEYAEDRVQWERLVRGEIPRYQMAKRYYRKDGKVLWGFLTCTLIRDEAGEPRFILGMVEDITREHEARQALALSEERFRLLSKAANDGIYDWDLDANTVWRNEGFEELYGHTVAALGSSVDGWADLIHPDDRERTLGSMRAAIASSVDKWSGEYRFRRKDGGYAHVLDQGHIVRNAEGRAIRMIGANTDLTSRKEGELRLAQQAALLDAAHDAILVKAMDDRITYWSKGAERTYGWSSTEAIGRKAFELFGVDPVPYEEARALLLDHGKWEGEFIERGKDGIIRDVSVRWSLLRDEAGCPTSILAITSDVTERKRLEIQFLRAQRLESLGTLAGGIAHDLNNVLAPILVSIELLRMDDDDPERQESLATIEASAKRGAAMVQQVLTFARGVEGKRVPIDPARVVREVEKIARDTFPKAISIRLTAPPGIWSTKADATQIHQVLMNLCVNARDAMPHGGTLSLTLTNVVIDEIFARMHPDARRGPYVAIAVADTGVGIPPAVQDRLFEPFFTTKEVGKGTGLGLSTVHTIVRSHRGFISLDSEVGKGARFVVHLPALLGTAAVPDAGGLVAHLPRGNGELILVVDDEESIRSIVQRTLERFGYRVMLAGNGAEGVAYFVEHRADIAVVLTDMAMPLMDGPAMIAALLAIDPDVKIVASSGLTSGGSMADALAAGVTDFVGKPYTAETLLTALYRVLHKIT